MSVDATRVRLARADTAEAALRLWSGRQGSRPPEHTAHPRRRAQTRAGSMKAPLPARIPQMPSGFSRDAIAAALLKSKLRTGDPDCRAGGDVVETGGRARAVLGCIG